MLSIASPAISLIITRQVIDSVTAVVKILRTKRGVAGLTGSHGRFIWHELTTLDVKAAAAFYRDVVGWGVQDASVPGMHYTLCKQDQASVCGMLELSDAARQLGARPTWMGYVGVDDVDVTASRIRALGGKVHVEPRDIPGVSRFAVVADPQMATFALFKWLRQDQRQTMDPQAPGQVGWHELLASDWRAVWSFYEQIFGWQKERGASGETAVYQYFSRGMQPIGGMLDKPAMVPAPFWLHYFNSADIDAAVERVKAGRGQVVNGPMQVSDGKWIVQCIDPQGAFFALIGPRSVAALAKPRYDQITVFKVDRKKK